MTGIDVAPGHDDGIPRTSVLFVCTHNSARSIMGEALLRAKGGHGFVVESAGTSAAPGTEEERLEAFRKVFTAMSQRIDLFLNVHDERETADPD